MRTYGGVAVKVACLVVAATIDPTGAVVTAIRGVLDNLSKARIIKASLTKKAPGSVTAATGVYCDDQDKLFATFRDANGEHETYRIPCPNAGIFVDGEKLDLGNAAVIAWAGWMTTNAKSATGVALVALEHGQRGRLSGGGRA